MITNIVSFKKEEGQIIYTENPAWKDLEQLDEVAKTDKKPFDKENLCIDPEKRFKTFVVEGEDPLGFSERSYDGIITSFREARKNLGLPDWEHLPAGDFYKGLPKKLDP